MKTAIRVSPKESTLALSHRRLRPTETLYLSPSDLHYRQTDAANLELSFRGGDVTSWQRKLRAKVAELIGAFPKKRVALNPRSFWKRQHAFGTIEKIVFTAEPHSDVIAYVCLPKDVPPPYTFFICMQGHTTGAHNSVAVDRENDKLAIEVPGDRDFGIGCMKRGVAALCIEQRSFGYRREQKQKIACKHPCQDAAMHALMLGRTLMSERIYDVDRSIDYLASRGDADMSRIGVMGNSGGGTISLFSAALLPRISFAMPSCYYCTFADSIMRIEHCTDNYVPGLMNYAEMADVMGLFAPKPVVLVAGKTDPIFPVDAVRRSFKHLKKIYKAAGAEDRCHLVIGPEGHRFYADLAWPKMLREMRR
ncbi:MAG TPA: alpha/beta hydrolase family protein [Planctomycetota bacterium]|nr:alpha/beta hydrolase family protein [Planctomycetota bacterium]